MLVLTGVPAGVVLLRLVMTTPRLVHCGLCLLLVVMVVIVWGQEPVVSWTRTVRSPRRRSCGQFVKSLTYTGGGVNVRQRSDRGIKLLKICIQIHPYVWP